MNDCLPGRRNATRPGAPHVTYFVHALARDATERVNDLRIDVRAFACDRKLYVRATLVERVSLRSAVVVSSRKSRPSSETEVEITVVFPFPFLLPSNVLA